MREINLAELQVIHGGAIPSSPDSLPVEWMLSILVTQIIETPVTPQLNVINPIIPIVLFGALALWTVAAVRTFRNGFTCNCQAQQTG